MVVDGESAAFLRWSWTDQCRMDAPHATEYGIFMRMVQCMDLGHDSHLH